MLHLFSDEMRRNPYPVYARLRDSSPVLHVPEADLWMVFDYEGVKRALQDHETFSSDMFVTGRGNPEWFIFFDPPRHTKLRALVMKAFTPKMVAALEPRIRELSCELLDQVIDRGEMDLAADFAIPLPLMVIAEMLGIPLEEQAPLKRWTDAILGLSYTVSHSGESAGAAVNVYAAATAEMAAYLSGLAQRRLQAPASDLLSGLVVAEVDGERLSPQELLGFFQLLLLAGSETTTNLINNAVLSLLEFPDQLELLTAQPELLPSALEEVLRFRSPIQAVFRATRRPVELSGATIPEGQLLLAVVGSANRDPKAFNDPDAFVVTRHPNPHVAFGHGVHSCLGAALSRLEGRVALTELLGRVQHIELLSDQPWEPRPAFHVHGPTRLPIRFQRKSTNS